jgi:hypothetical protein
VEQVSPICYRSYLGMTTCYHGSMKAEKISISLEPALSDEVRAAAMKAGIGVSRWLAEAAAAKLRAEALADFLDVWQKEHGSITTQELSRAESELGLKRRRRIN